MTESSSKPQQLRDELEALRTRVAELEDSQPKDLELKELKSEVRSAGKKLPERSSFLWWPLF